MWGSVTTLIGVLPSWYIMILLPFLIMLGVWVFSRIRRDPQGKRYFYSQKYEDAKRNRKQNEIIERMDKLASFTLKNRKDILQLQLCSNIPTTGKRMAYLEYTSSGFNSWADQYVIDQGLFTEEEVRYIKKNNKADGWKEGYMHGLGQFSRRAEDKKMPPFAGAGPVQETKDDTTS